MKLFLVLIFTLLAKQSIAQENYLWEFSYDMKIKKLNLKTEHNKEESTKEHINSFLKQNYKICTSNNKDIKKEIKKIFPGCNFYYENTNNNFSSNISCDNIEYSINLTPKSYHDFRGNIHLEKNSEDFDLNAEGLLILKRIKPCETN